MRPYWRRLAVFLICLVALGVPTTPKAVAGGLRLSKQEQSQIKHLRKLQHKSRTVINFWNHRGHWALFSKHGECWQVEGDAQRRACHLARKSLVAHSQRLAQIRKKLERLSTPHDSGYLPPAQAMKLGQRMAVLRGWTGNQWNCLKRLWGPLESSWYALADNPNSDAYGIPQALPGEKMGPGWESSAFVQIKWGLGYIKDRYHTPCGALAYRLAHHYY